MVELKFCKDNLNLVIPIWCFYTLQFECVSNYYVYQSSISLSISLDFFHTIELFFFEFFFKQQKKNMKLSTSATNFIHHSKNKKVMGWWEENGELNENNKIEKAQNELTT